MATLNDISNANSSNNRDGSVLLRKGTKFQSYGLSWDGVTVFRPYAAPNADRSQLLPWMTDSDQFSPWISIVPSVVRNVGVNRKITFASELSDSERSDLGFTTTPYQVFFNRLKARSKDPNYSWLEHYFKGANNQSAPISQAKALGVMQGILYAHGDKNYVARPKADVFLMLSPSATTSMGQLLRVVKNIFVDDSGNPNLLYFCQNSAAVMLPPKFTVAQLNPSYSEDEYARSQQFRSHMAHLVTADKSAIQVATPDFNLDHWRDWSDLINILTAKEQVELICSAFDPAVSYLAFVDSEFEQYLPSYVRQRVNVHVATGQPQTHPQTQPQQQQSFGFAPNHPQAPTGGFGAPVQSGGFGAPTGGSGGFGSPSGVGGGFGGSAPRTGFAAPQPKQASAPMFNQVPAATPTTTKPAPEPQPNASPFDFSRESDEGEESLGKAPVQPIQPFGLPTQQPATPYNQNTADLVKARLADLAAKRS